MGKIPLLYDKRDDEENVDETDSAGTSGLAKKNESRVLSHEEAMLSWSGLKNKAIVRELSPEQTERLLKNIQERFENEDNMKNRHPGMKWSEVLARLEANPEKLWSLNEMERTGGEPDVVLKKNSGGYIFYDCSAESPIGRRNCVYDKAAEEYLKLYSPNVNHLSNAQSIAEFMRMKVLNENEYDYLQELGEFDLNTSSWVVPYYVLGDEDSALIACRIAKKGDTEYNKNDNGIYLAEGDPNTAFDTRGFRGKLLI